MKEEKFNEILAQLRNNAIVTLNLKKEVAGHMSDAQLTQFCEVLKENTSLEDLNIRDMHLGSDLPRIVGLLKDLTTLKSLDISNNKVDQEGMEELAKYLKENPNLKILKVCENKLGYEGCQALHDGLKDNTNLIELDLATNLITPSAMDVLCSFLKQNKSIQNLSLKDNKLGVKGCKFLGELLSANQTLKEVIVSGNVIEDEGCILLMEGLEGNKSIVSMDIGKNRLGIEGQKAIAQMFKENSTIEKFSLQNTRIGNVGVKTLAQGLMLNESLTSFNISENRIGDNGIDSLLPVIKKNPNLRDVSIASNEITPGGSEKLNSLLRGMEPRKRAKKSQDPQPSKLVVISSEEQTKSSLTDEQFDTLTNDIDKVKQENQELKKIIVKQNDLIRKIQEEKKLEKESLPLHSVFPAQSILDFQVSFYFHQLNFSTSRESGIYALAKLLYEWPKDADPPKLGNFFSYNSTNSFIDLLRTGNQGVQKGIVIFFSICFSKFDFTHLADERLINTLSRCQVIPHISRDIGIKYYKKNLTARFLRFGKLEDDCLLSDDNHRFVETYGRELQEVYETKLDLEKTENEEIVVIDLKNDEKLKSLLEESESVLLNTYKIDAEYEGFLEIVNRVMGEKNSQSECTEHIKELLTEHGREIPLSKISIGSPRHKSILFKLLCDHNKVPCWLMRRKTITNDVFYWNLVIFVKNLVRERRTWADILWDQEIDENTTFDDPTFFFNSREDSPENYEVIESWKGDIGHCSEVSPLNERRKKFILKVVPLETESNQKHVINEAKLICIFQHPNIVAYHNCFLHVSENQLSLFLLSNKFETSLEKIIEDYTNRQQAFSTQAVLLIAYELIAALEYLYAPIGDPKKAQPRMPHRNVKPSNIFLVNDKELGPTIKVGDYGLTKIIGETKFLRLAYAYDTFWLPPEMRRNNRGVNHFQETDTETSSSSSSFPILMTSPYSPDAKYTDAHSERYYLGDCFCVGIVLAQMMCLQKPRKNYPLVEMADFRKEANYPHWFKKLVIDSLSLNPRVRPTFKQMNETIINNSIESLISTSMKFSD